MVLAAKSELLEREPELELELIASGLGSALHGAGRAVMFEGPAGIGKTSLLRTAARLAEERGMRVLLARR